MRSHALRFAFALLSAALLRAGDSLSHARRAQALLGPDVWSEVIRVENDARSHRYPRVLHALVFELAGVLWFYADTDGTQSFSLRRGRLDEEKADLAPLLRAIEPGFARWSVVPDDDATPGELPNGCFIESVAALRARLARGGETVHPQLLGSYVNTPAGLAGHTVLTYTTRGGIEVIDPDVPTKRRELSVALAGDALALARALFGSEVARARLVSLDDFIRKTVAVVARGPTNSSESSVTLQ